MKQNEPKLSNANPEPATAIHDQYLLIMSTIRQVLTIPLLTEETLFTWKFRRLVSLFKYLQEFQVTYQ